MSSSKPPLVLIAGPTASGKSALALALAQQINAVIVNADSAQIYKDLQVLSAAPTKKQLGQAEHRLYGVADGTIACSASDWAAMAKREITQIHAEGRTPVLVGGTGLYIRTLFDGIAPVPPIYSDVRARVRESSLDANLAELAKLDPEASQKLHPSDTTRINRSLEVILSTGIRLSEWQKQREGGIAEFVDVRPIILQPPRDWLYQRCNERFAAMVKEGAVSEVEALLKRKLNPNLPVMRAIGVRELSNYLLAKIPLDEAVAAGQQATRRYAKRQYTWFAHQPPPAWPRFCEPLETDNLVSALALLNAKA